VAHFFQSPLPAGSLLTDGVMNIIDIQIVINAALGLGCAAT
jgi:hypothetical protein